MLGVNALQQLCFLNTSGHPLNLKVIFLSTKSNTIAKGQSVVTICGDF